MAHERRDPRLSVQESLNLVRLHSEEDDVQKYMSTRSSWVPGSDFPFLSELFKSGKTRPVNNGAVFGGTVYSQSALATCRSLREDEEKKGLPKNERFGLHAFHGFFTHAGRADRPFIHTVSPKSTSKTFATYTVTAHQPVSPSTSPSGDDYPVSDASLPAGPPCFTAIASFKQREPHSNGVDVSEAPAQVRFASVLGSRVPEAWPPSPPVDIAALVDFVGNDVVGTFPCVEGRKVDMTAYNSGRPLHERRELLLYRLLQPLPADGTGGWDANAHLAVHAFQADRNGLLTLGNHLGFGFRFGRSASLSYSFVVHTDPEPAVLRHEDPRWWLQEMYFPRAGAGRGVVESKIWSPDGVHIATEYQDGVVRATHETKGLLPKTMKL